MTPATIAASLTPKMREALENALKRSDLEDRPVLEAAAKGGTLTALYRLGLAYRGERLTYSNEPGRAITKKAPLLTPLGLAVRNQLKGEG